MFPPAQKKVTIGQHRILGEFKPKYPPPAPIAASEVGTTKEIIRKLNQIEERLARMEKNLLESNQ
ncbi:MAG TPA: hypothetical protein VHZ24_21345 [Pirellulales bacterium]|nr:hypothetical protein [Pirellulales bacterium]